MVLITYFVMSRLSRPRVVVYLKPSLCFDSILVLTLGQDEGVVSVPDNFLYDSSRENLSSGFATR